MRKGELMLKVLEIVGGGLLTTANIIEAIISSPYGSSYSQINRKISEIEQRQAANSRKLQKERWLYDLLYRLKRDNILEQKTRKNGKVWFITEKGRRWIKIFKKKQTNYIPLKEYAKVADNELKIVAFDIPEKYRRKRAWLRAALTRLNFTMLQKSLWVGRVKLPKDFIQDLHELQLISYVEILAVTKTGSLKQLTDNTDRQ
jgi:DNA-binding PadR family transcriptional regulator